MMAEVFVLRWHYDACLMTSQKHYIILLYIIIIYYMKYYRNNNQGERDGSEGKGNEHLFLGMEPRVLHMWCKWHHSKALYY